MSLLLRTNEELMKIEGLNADVLKDPDFTLVMYNEDNKEILSTMSISGTHPLC